MEKLPSNIALEDGRAGEILTFSVGGRLFGILPKDLLEIVEMGEPTPIPNAPDFLAGVINSRGRLVTIVDLNKLIDFKDPLPSAPQRVAILNDEKFMIGILVSFDLGIKFYNQDAPPASSEKSLSFFKDFRFSHEDKSEEVSVLEADLIYKFLRDYLKKRSIKTI